MNIFLQTLSDKISEGRHVAMIVDNAGWHTAKALKIPQNITLIPLPPYSPELNAMEQIWEWLRNHHFSNQYYQSYGAIEEHACKAWNDLADNKVLVQSIMKRGWVSLP